MLFLKIVLLELTFFVIYLSFMVLFSSLVRPLIQGDGLGMYLVIYVLVAFIKSTLLFVAISLWVRDYYELSPGMIIYKTGLFKRHSSSFKLNNITALEVDQSFLGRMFNYGTVELQNPFMSNHFFLTNVPNPKKCLRLIRENMEEGTIRVSQSS